MSRQRESGRCGVGSVRTRSTIVAVLAAGLSAAASAVDLSVSDIISVQSVQLGNTPLIAGRSTMVRATVSVTGAAVAVPGVDALLRVYINGVQAPWSPVFSTNGPIAAPLSPNLATLGHSLNFVVVLPESGDIDLRIEVDPLNAIGETNETNNALEKKNLIAQCKQIVDLAYVPIDYVPGGGLPSAAFTEPGVGDGFVRAIYGPRELNYHRAPVAPLVWTQSVNSSDDALLNALQDILLNQIPAAGQPKPDFIYGWLKGNPYSGNGRANGIPGDTAFGNTDPARFQRTFAHELGHLVGLQHNSATIATNGIDVEHHLADTQSLPQLFVNSKKDIMVAGLLTADAFIREASLLTFLNDNRVKCLAGSPVQGGGAPGEDDTAGLRVSGVITHALPRSATIDPVFVIDEAAPTRDDPTGDILILARDADGNAMTAIRSDTRRSRMVCSGAAEMHPRSPFYVVVPRSIDGVTVESIEIIDLLFQQSLGTLARSANPPVIAVVEVVPVAEGAVPGGPDPVIMTGQVRIAWSASDADGDELVHHVFYSPDEGASWVPVAMNVTAQSLEFDSSYLPSTQGFAGHFRVRTSDGFGSVDSPIHVAAAMGTGTPPDVHLITPNSNSTHLQSASVVLHASVWDLEDQYLPESTISWLSSLDGEVGSGRLLVNASLSPGTHLLSVTATDTDGLSSTDTTTITVTGREVFPSPDLDSDGAVDGLDLGTLLSQWGGPGTADLDLSGVVDGADLGLLIANWTS